MNLYKKHQITISEAPSPRGTLYYARIDGVQQIDYQRNRGDFKTPEEAETFARQLIDSGDWGTKP